MVINKISFGAKFAINSAHNNVGMDKKSIFKENEYAQMARDMGVSIPTYNITLDYETKGEIANYPNNKIEKNHLKDLFKNLYQMDTNNFSHNDLDLMHVFYGKDGKVELDCFRFYSPFMKGNNKMYALPDYMMPSNQINYENAGLGFYVEQIPTQKEKIEFLKGYLEAQSDYHEKRAKYIASGENPNFTKEMLDFEITAAEAMKNPDNEMSALLLSRLYFLTQQRKAFTEFDEGNGACGHPFDKARRIKSIPMYFDAIKGAINYKNEALNLAQNADSKIKQKYYMYEAKFGEYFANTYLSWVEGMADYNFSDKRVCPLDKEQREKLKAEYQKIINSDNNKIELMDKYIEMYSNHTQL